MSIYFDPIVPALDPPSDAVLKNNPIRFGNYYMTLSKHQWQFVMAAEKFVTWTGGVRCLSAETFVGGIPVAERSTPGMVDTLIGPMSMQASFLKATATALYLVSTRSRKEVVVSLGHHFLTPVGWRPLECLAVGSLIGGHDSERVHDGMGTHVNWRARYSSDSRPYGELPSPFEVYTQDRFQQYAWNGICCRDTSVYPSRIDDLDLSSADWYGSERHVGRDAFSILLDEPHIRQRFEKHSLSHSDSVLLYRPMATCERIGDYQNQLECRSESGRDSQSSAMYPDAQPFSSGCRLSQNPPESLSRIQDQAIFPSQHSNTWDEITDIQFVKYGDVYDLTVPGADHYLAHGLYHHNSGKSMGGIARSLKLSLFIPDNRGIVGRQFASDLELTTQRDFLEIADATGLVKFRNDKRLVMYCWDLGSDTIRPDRATSETLFLHLDNPKHLKSHGLGWAWMEEANESDKRAYFRLVDRLSRPAAEGHYSVFLTANPEGHDWLWDHFWNPQTILKRPISARLMHRCIHNKTKDCPFLTEEYLTNLYATAPEDWLNRYAEGEFDVFEGQIFKEFSEDIHCVNSHDCHGFKRGFPPFDWIRYMGIDTGGTDPWAFETAAVDPWGNLVFYDEIYRPEVYVRSFEKELKEKMKPGQLTFKRISMDSENKVAQEELRQMGIRVSNAKKMNKREGAINRLARYLHPNPLRPFPDWHPRKGQLGSPGIFFTEGCPKLKEEIPQQRWREISGIAVNEADPTVPNHGTDSCMYLIRERPEPNETWISPLALLEAKTNDLRSKAYWGRVVEERERIKQSRWKGLLPDTKRQRIFVN